MPLQKQPFRSYTLDEDKVDPMDRGKVFTTRLNALEWKLLKQDMDDFNIRNQSAMLKLLAEIGRHVLHGTFGREKLRWLFRRDRVKIEPE